MTPVAMEGSLQQAVRRRGALCRLTRTRSIRHTRSREPETHQGHGAFPLRPATHIDERIATATIGCKRARVSRAHEELAWTEYANAQCQQPTRTYAIAGATIIADDGRAAWDAERPSSRWSQLVEATKPTEDHAGEGAHTKGESENVPAFAFPQTW